MIGRIPEYAVKSRINDLLKERVNRAISVSDADFASILVKFHCFKWLTCYEGEDWNGDPHDPLEVDFGRGASHALRP